MRHGLQRFLIIIGIIISGLLALSGNALAQEEEAWALFGLSIMAILICFVIFIVIAIVIGIWVYRDANSRGMNGTLWLILVIVLTLFVGIIGLIIIVVIYLVVRHDKPAYPPGYGYPPPGPGYYPPPPPGGQYPPPPPR